MENWNYIIGIIIILIIIKIIFSLINFSGENYSSKKSILTKTELKFWKVLREIIPKGAVLTIKPRIADVLTPKIRNKEKKGEWQSAFNKICGKHVDFLLIDEESGAPLLAIELDDKSHDRDDRKLRDRFVDKAFADAKIPILHVVLKTAFEKERLIKNIEEKLNPQKITNTVSKIP